MINSVVFMKNVADIPYKKQIQMDCIQLIFIPDKTLCRPQVGRWLEAFLFLPPPPKADCFLRNPGNPGLFYFPFHALNFDPLFVLVYLV